MTTSLRIPAGSIEHVRAQVKADTVLDGQVWMAITPRLGDETTWIPATWVGDAALTRTAQVLLDTTDLEVGRIHQIFVRFTAQYEMPIVDAGELTVVTT